MVTKTLLEEYIAKLRLMKGYRDATIARKVAALKSFFTFLVQENTIAQDPAKSLGQPRVRQTSPEYLSEQEVSQLLERAAQDNTPAGQRDAAVLEVLYLTGLQVSELISLNVADINLEESSVQCQSKGSKVRIVHLPPGWLDRPSIKRYLTTARPALLRRHQNISVLFVNHRGQRLTRQWVWNILKTHGQKAGVKRITPQTLRHSLAVYLLQNGSSFQGVQEVLGHSTIYTTRAMYAGLLRT